MTRAEVLALLREWLDEADRQFLRCDQALTPSRALMYALVELQEREARGPAEMWAEK